MVKKIFFCLCLLLLSSLLLVGCQQKETNSDGLPEIKVISAKEIYPEALVLANAWSENAVLKKIDVPIIGPNYITKIEDILIDFLAPEYSWEYLSVRCNYSGCTSGTYDNFYSNMTPIEFDEVEIDSIEAAHIGLINGGDKYIQRSRGSGNLILRWSKEGSLEWLVFFYCDGLDVLYIYINPFTGEVIDK